MRFADPPTKYRRRATYDWDKIYAAIKDNPGEWAVIAEPGTVSTYNAVTQGKIKNFLPAMGIEMRTSDNDFKATPRTCTIWCRYNPDLDESLTVKQRQQAWRDIRARQKEKENMKVSTVESED